MDRKNWVVSEDEDPLYPWEVAARLARISLDLLNYCERENLIQLRTMRGGGRGLNRQDVRRLVRIRRLQEDLELELPAIEIVLRMRRQILDLMLQLDEMERVTVKREEELISEIRSLRKRVAEEFPWEIHLR